MRTLSAEQLDGIRYIELRKDRKLKLAIPNPTTVSIQ